MQLENNSSKAIFYSITMLPFSTLNTTLLNLYSKHDLLIQFLNSRSNNILCKRHSIMIFNSMSDLDAHAREKHSTDETKKWLKIWYDTMLIIQRLHYTTLRGPKTNVSLCRIHGLHMVIWVMSTRCHRTRELIR